MTLVELMTVMAILGIVLAAFTGILSTSLTQSAQEQEMTAIQTEARAAIEQFARDYRQIYSGVDGSWPVEAISSTSIQFLSPQRLTPFRLQRIQWQLNGTDLQRRFVTSSNTNGAPWTFPTAITSAAWDTRARAVRNTSTAVFTGFKADGVTQTTVPSEVRIVQITVEASTSGGQTKRKFTFTTRITPRVTPT
jgi:prepilin-type N-terminal cleavage/methylation domain-containing protein